MTVRTFLLGCGAAAVAGTGAWILVLFNLSPTQAGASGLMLFFLSLFVGLASWAALIGYGARRLVTRRQFPTYAVRASLRQGISIGLFTVFILLLQLLRLYQWWIAVLLIVLIGSIELIFLGYDRSHYRQPREDSK